MTADAYELSAAYINGLVRAAKRDGVLESVLADAPPDFKSRVLQPAVQPWWDARFAEDLAAAIREAFGDTAVEQVGYDVVTETMGPIAQPLIEQALASGAGPAALFGRMNEFAALAVRPIRVEWAPSPGKAGQVQYFYPRALRPETALLWRGVIRYAFEITRAQGRIDAQHDGPPPGRLAFDVAWA